MHLLHLNYLQVYSFFNIANRLEALLFAWLHLLVYIITLLNIKCKHIQKQLAYKTNLGNIFAPFQWVCVLFASP